MWTGKAFAARVGDLKKRLRWEIDAKANEEIQEDNAKVDCGNELESWGVCRRLVKGNCTSRADYKVSQKR